MYEPETILTLKEPRGTEDEPFPYDRVKVIGQSPINHGTASEEWAGANGQGVIIEPLTSFGSTLDEPFGKIQELYTIESVPPPVEVVPPKVLTPESLGASPEEVFAAEADKQGQDARRAAPKKRKLPSPLGESKKPSGPLDKPPVRGAEEEIAPEATD